MFKVIATMDAGYASISSLIGSYPSIDEAKLVVKDITEGGFYGKGEGLFGDSKDNEIVFFCPKYIKRVTIREEQNDIS